MIFLSKRCCHGGAKIKMCREPFLIGASNGCWTIRAKKIFPEAQFVEAQKEHELDLATVKKKVDRIDYVIAAAGNYNGTVYFDFSAG